MKNKTKKIRTEEKKNNKNSKKKKTEKENLTMNKRRFLGRQDGENKNLFTFNIKKTAKTANPNRDGGELF